MLSVTSQHALRALTHIAALPDGESILGRNLSERAGIPPNYLSKILLTLGNAGFLRATRGLGGGYRLLKKPNKIRLIEVVELFDRPSARPQCFLGGGRICSDRTACTAHGGFRDVRSVYLHFLESTTIADISVDGQGRE